MKKNKIDELIILILNYNSAKDTLENIINIRKQDIKSKILVVDNCSIDDSFSFLREKLSKIENTHIIQSPINGGYAKGNNYGLHYIDENYKCKYTLISNPDVEFTKKLLEKKINILETNSLVSSVGAKMIDFNSQNLVSAWKQPNIFYDLIFSISILNKIFRKTAQYRISKELQPVDVLQGALFMIRFSDFKKIGYFDNRTFLYGEERILALKIRALRKINILISNMTFKHKVGASINQEFPNLITKYKQLQESRRIYYKFYFSKIYSFLFEIIFILGLIEKYIIYYTIRITN